MRAATGLAVVALTGCLAAGAAAADDVWRVVEVGRIKGLLDLRRDADNTDEAVVETAAGHFRLRFSPGRVELGAPLSAEPGPPDLIPHGRVVQGDRDIRRAWLAEPTRRYGHAVLGDGVEAGALAVETTDGTVLYHRLAEDAVFEDLTPRLMDLDGDGRDEILVIRSGSNDGAAAVLFGLREGQVQPLAASTPIGTANRWLNPVGAGDFDGDGTPEVAVVRTPHIGGILILYRWRGTILQERARRSGLSNHRIGSIALGLGVILDVDGDGVDDLVLPSQSRKTVVALSRAGGDWREIAEVPLPDAVATSFLVHDIDEDRRPEILMGLADGSIVALLPH